MSWQDKAVQMGLIGTGLGPAVLERCRALYADEQVPLAHAVAPLATDCAYGPAERNVLDLYGPRPGALRPVVLFVHGGGFVLGDKGGAGDAWPNAHAGRWAARHGMVGAVMNYRLAPADPWPAGAEDVAAAVAWLRANVAQHGGDPARIFLLGTSAGAVHIAGYLRLVSGHADEVRAAALLSGLYGFTPLDERDERYYGAPDLYPRRMPRDAVVETTLPIFTACAQYDPARFQAEWSGLLAARLERHGALPRAHYASGHNHYTLAMHLGTADTRLSDELRAFFADHA